MFLHLITEKNKQLFLSLTKSLCHADGHFTDDERAMVEQYCKELEIASDSADAVSDPKELMQQLAASSDAREKKIIVFELLGLAHVDKEFSADERRFVEELRTVFEMDTDYIQRAEELIRSYLDIQDRVNALILG